MEIKKYYLGETQVNYLINDKGNVEMFLLPKGMEDLVKEQWNIEGGIFDPRLRYKHTWAMGGLVYFYTSDLDLEHPGFTMKSQDITAVTYFDSQEVIEENNEKKIITTLKCEGYTLKHYLVYKEGLRGLECYSEFINTKNEDATLRMLSSFAMDNLSPLQIDDAPDKYKFHRFYGGWSKEGKLHTMTVEEMGLEKTWAGWNCSSERFGSLGSYPVHRYFSTAAFEDTEHGVLWGAQIALNSTWQMELSRYANTLSFSGGLGDYLMSGWEKVIKPNDSFKSPVSYIATVKGDIEDVCSALTDMQKPAYFAYGEKGIPTSFNEYCTTWGRPTQEKMLSYANALKDLDVKYLVIDAGWCKAGKEQDGNGEWIPDKTIFPDMKGMNRKIREMGMIPGIWFEFEVTTKGSKYYESDYDYLHLTRDGRVISISGARSYLDFRKDEVKAHLKKKVIDLLRDNDFGYIKVDYNRNIGTTVDGEESGAEELRKHLEEVRNFFKQMKKEIPDLVIENCASGGHRLEPSMMGITGMSSFSDAHECVEIPYIAANLHNLMLPAQSLIWAVLRADNSIKHEIYSLCATFLGRVCLSGEIDKINDEQRAVLKDALRFYKNLDNVIINGDSKIYGNRGNNTRYPKGTQAVFRKTIKDAMVVCHAFENPSDGFDFEIPRGYKVVDSFGADCIKVCGNKVEVGKMEEFSAGAIYLVKE